MCACACVCGSKGNPQHLRVEQYLVILVETLRCIVDLGNSGRFLNVVFDVVVFIINLRSPTKMVTTTIT